MTVNEHHSPRRSRAARAAAPLIGIALLAGCGAGDSQAAGPSGDGGASAITNVAFTTGVQPTYVNTWYGPIDLGEEHGLELTKDSFTVFEAHSTGAQAVLSGEAQVMGSSFISTALLQEQGQEMEVFCSFNNADTLALVARNGIDSVDQLFDPETRVATDSPGGAGSMVFNALLEALDAEGNVEDLPNTTVLESSSLRANAFAADQVDVAVIHIRQFDAAAGQVPDGKILATLADDAEDMVMQAFAAPSSWLEENRDTAVEFCASVLRANRELAGDFAAFSAAVDSYVEEPPGEEELRGIHEVIERSNIWPADGLTEEAVRYTLDLAERSGVLTAAADPADVVNWEIVQAAQERAGETS